MCYQQLKTANDMPCDIQLCLAFSEIQCSGLYGIGLHLIRKQLKCINLAFW